MRNKPLTKSQVQALDYLYSGATVLCDRRQRGYNLASFRALERRGLVRRRHRRFVLPEDATAPNRVKLGSSPTWESNVRGVYYSTPTRYGVPLQVRKVKRRTWCVFLDSGYDIVHLHTARTLELCQKWVAQSNESEVRRAIAYAYKTLSR